MNNEQIAIIALGSLTFIQWVLACRSKRREERLKRSLSAMEASFSAAIEMVMSANFKNNALLAENNTLRAERWGQGVDLSKCPDCGGFRGHGHECPKPPLPDHLAAIESILGRPATGEAEKDRWERVKSAVHELVEARANREAKCEEYVCEWAHRVFRVENGGTLKQMLAAAEAVYKGTVQAFEELADRHDATLLKRLAIVESWPERDELALQLTPRGLRSLIQLDLPSEYMRHLLQKLP